MKTKKYEDEGKTGRVTTEIRQKKKKKKPKSIDGTRNQPNNYTERPSIILPEPHVLFGN